MDYSNVNAFALQVTTTAKLRHVLPKPGELVLLDMRASIDFERLNARDVFDRASKPGSEPVSPTLLKILPETQHQGHSYYAKVWAVECATSRHRWPDTRNYGRGLFDSL